MFWYFFGLVGLALLICSVIAITKGANESTVKAPVITPMGFEAPGRWTVPTRYAASFLLGPRSDPTPPISSETQTNPKFSIPLTSQTLGQVQWFRSVPPYDTWVPHIMKRDSVNVFVDVLNPSLLAPIPTPPALVGNGKFAGKWNTEADDEVVPWVLPSKYRVRYLFGDMVGPWGPYTEEFVSDTYSNPSLRAEPHPLYQLEWEVCGRVITLPSVPNKAASLGMKPEDGNSFGVNTPFDAWWSPGADNLVMSPVNFVNVWNASKHWPMNVLDDGTLQIVALDPRGGSGNISLDSSFGNQWWEPMGFDKSGVWELGEVITAARSVANPTCRTKKGTATFIDQGNPFK